MITPKEIKGSWAASDVVMFTSLDVSDSTILVGNRADTIFTVRYSISHDTLITYAPFTNQQFKNRIVLLTKDTLVLDGIMDVKETRHYSRRSISRKSEQTWFTAKCLPLCDEEKGKMVSKEKVSKHHTYNPYDTTQVLSNDSVKISFDFIANCCLNFSGNAYVRKDTLILEYARDSSALCDCLCDYRMIYQISRAKHWAKTKINHLERGK